MTRGVAHPQELRAQVVAAVLAGTTVAEAARQFGVSKSLASEWSQSAEVRTIRTEKMVSDAELIMGYFRAALRAMIAQAELFADDDYCRRQDADKLALAHGILGTKLAGIAETAQSLGLIGPPLELPAGPADAAPGAADDDR
jgi:hypothetical protein